MLLYENRPVLGIVVEVQLAVDEHKRYAWPVYAVGLRARMRCPVCVLVITAQESVVRWAGSPIELGGGNTFRPFVIGPSGVPVITDEARAIAEPELAVLSAMAHGGSTDSDLAVQVATAAMVASLAAGVLLLCRRSAGATALSYPHRCVGSSPTMETGGGRR